MDNIWERHRAVWKQKKLLRDIYFGWYRQIVSDLTKGKTVEIGSGTGNFKEYYPKAITSDIVKLPGIDMCFDATKMPFTNSSIGNIVMIDTLHHLPDPEKFLYEAYRVLKPGGRVIMMEPFPSPVSLLVYRLFHKEPFVFKVDYFGKSKSIDKDPWESNQAIPYLVFFKNVNMFKKVFNNKFKILKSEKTSLLVYPLSGGFEGPQLLPQFFVPVITKFEKLLQFIKHLTAFRCYVVLEKNNEH